MKKVYINELKNGDNIKELTFVIKNFKSLSAANKKEYWNITLGDKTGEIYAKVWQDSFVSCDKVKIGDIVIVSGEVTEYKDRKQVIISNMLITEEFDANDLIEKSNKDLDKLFDYVKKEIAEVSNEHLKKLLQDFFNDEKFLDEYKIAPGAQKIHHAYLGGLLEHSAEMLKFSKSIVEEYPAIDKDLLTTGILLHDIGKMQEFNINGGINRTVKGKLIGHLSMSALEISKKMDLIKDFPENLKNKVLNLILSHHGLLEYGSPVKPLLLESIVLYRLDELSSKTNIAAKLFEIGVDTPQDFSERNFALDSEIYIGKEEDDDSNQQQLI